MNRPDTKLLSLPAKLRGTSGSGFRQWSTKRPKQFKTALEGLSGLADAGDVPRLVLSFGVIADFLAPSIPVGKSSLPRGYEWTVNGEGDASFRIENQLLSPGIPDPLPNGHAAIRFATDLQTGLLDEIATVCGLKGPEAFFDKW